MLNRAIDAVLEELAKEVKVWTDARTEGAEMDKTEMVVEYLDSQLRDCGTVRIPDAELYIQEEFGLSAQETVDVLVDWLVNFPKGS